MKYTVDYFIKKFEAIPEELWLTNTYGRYSQHCAFGHCGMRSDDEAVQGRPEPEALDKILCRRVVEINDGDDSRYTQPTPKQRVLAALYDIKKMQQPEYPDITKELAVLPEDKTETDLIKMKNPRIFT